jgi:hypothetical protein
MMRTQSNRKWRRVSGSNPVPEVNAGFGDDELRPDPLSLVCTPAEETIQIGPREFVVAS